MAIVAQSDAQGRVTRVELVSLDEPVLIGQSENTFFFTIHPDHVRRPGGRVDPNDLIVDRADRVACGCRGSNTEPAILFPGDACPVPDVIQGRALDAAGEPLLDIVRSQLRIGLKGDCTCESSVQVADDTQELCLVSPGLPFPEQGTALDVGSDGSVYWSTTEGLFRFDPISLESTRLYAPVKFGAERTVAVLEDKGVIVVDTPDYGLSSNTSVQWITTDGVVTPVQIPSEKWRRVLRLPTELIVSSNDSLARCALSDSELVCVRERIIGCSGVDLVSLVQLGTDVLAISRTGHVLSREARGEWTCRAWGDDPSRGMLRLRNAVVLGDRVFVCSDEQDQRLMRAHTLTGTIAPVLRWAAEGPIDVNHLVECSTPQGPDGSYLFLGDQLYRAQDGSLVEAELPVVDFEASGTLAWRRNGAWIARIGASGAIRRERGTDLEPPFYRASNLTGLPNRALLELTPNDALVARSDGQLTRVQGESCSELQVDTFGSFEDPPDILFSGPTGPVAARLEGRSLVLSAIDVEDRSIRSLETIDFPFSRPVEVAVLGTIPILLTDDGKLIELRDGEAREVKTSEPGARFSKLRVGGQAAFAGGLATAARIIDLGDRAQAFVIPVASDSGSRDLLDLRPVCDSDTVALVARDKTGDSMGRDRLFELLRVDTAKSGFVEALPILPANEPSGGVGFGLIGSLNALTLWVSRYRLHETVGSNAPFDLESSLGGIASGTHGDIAWIKSR